MPDVTADLLVAIRADIKDLGAKVEEVHAALGTLNAANDEVKKKAEGASSGLDALHGTTRGLRMGLIGAVDAMALVGVGTGKMQTQVYTAVSAVTMLSSAADRLSDVDFPKLRSSVAETAKSLVSGGAAAVAMRAGLVALGLYAATQFIGQMTEARDNVERFWRIVSAFAPGFSGFADELIRQHRAALDAAGANDAITAALNREGAAAMAASRSTTATTAAYKVLADAAKKAAAEAKADADKARAAQAQWFSERVAQLQAEAVLQNQSVDEQVAALERLRGAHGLTAIQIRDLDVAITKLHESIKPPTEDYLALGRAMEGVASEASRVRGWLGQTMGQWAAVAEKEAAARAQAEWWAREIAKMTEDREVELWLLRMEAGWKKIEQAIAQAREAEEKFRKETIELGDAWTFTFGPAGAISESETILALMEERFGKMGESIYEMLTGITNAFGQFFVDVFSGTMSFGQALTNLWQGIVQSILQLIGQMIAKALLFLALQTLIGGPFTAIYGSGLEGLLKFILGTHDYGGVVTGPRLIAVGPGVTEAMIPLSGPGRSNGEAMMAGMGGRDARRQTRLLSRIASSLDRQGVPIGDLRLGREEALRMGFRMSAVGVR